MALCAAVTLMIPEPFGKSIDDIEQDVLYGASPSSSNASVRSGELVEAAEQHKTGTNEEIRKKKFV